MFENLTEKLQRTFKNLRGQGKLTEEHLDAALAEIREALLEGDVALPVIDELLASIRSKALGSEVMLQLSPDQQVIKLVRDELTTLLGKHAKQSGDRKSTRLNSSHVEISYAVFCLKKKKKLTARSPLQAKRRQPRAVIDHQ